MQRAKIISAHTSVLVTLDTQEMAQDAKVSWLSSPIPDTERTNCDS